MGFSQAFNEFKSFKVLVPLHLLGSLGGELSDRTVRWIGRKIYPVSFLYFKGSIEEFKKLEKPSTKQKIVCATLVLATAALIGGTVGLIGGPFIASLANLSSSAKYWFKIVAFVGSAAMGVFKAGVYLSEKTSPPAKKRRLSLDASLKPVRNNFKPNQPLQRAEEASQRQGAQAGLAGA